MNSRFTRNTYSTVGAEEVFSQLYRSEVRCKDDLKNVSPHIPKDKLQSDSKTVAILYGLLKQFGLCGSPDIIKKEMKSTISGLTVDELCKYDLGISV